MSIKRILTAVLIFVTLVAVAAFASACGEDSTPENTGAPASPSEPGVCTAHVDANRNGECDICYADMDIPCENHIDNDDDNICDICEDTVKLPVSYTITVTDSNGSAMSGIKLTFKKNGKVASEKYTDETGKISGTLIPGSYMLEWTELDYGWFIDSGSTAVISDNESENNLSYTAINNTTMGTENDPHFVDQERDWNFGAEQTLYFFVKGSVYIRITTPNTVLTYNGQAYNTDDGEIYILLDAPKDINSTTVFSVTNMNSDAVEIGIKPEALPGSSQNPYPLVLGEIIDVEVIKDGGGVCYSWTAQADGRLSITYADDNCIIQLENINASTGVIKAVKLVVKDGVITNSEENATDTYISFSESDVIRVTVDYNFEMTSSTSETILFKAEIE